MQLCSIDGTETVKVPINPEIKLKRSDCPTQEEIDANPGTHKHRVKYYQKIMGSCIFVNNVARPDISFG
jgi:hypothetical protein